MLRGLLYLSLRSPKIIAGCCIGMMVSARDMYS